MKSRKVVLPPSLAAQLLSANVRSSSLGSDGWSDELSCRHLWGSPEKIRRMFFEHLQKSDDGRDLPHLDWASFEVVYDEANGLSYLVDESGKRLTEIVDVTVYNDLNKSFSTLSGVVRGTIQQYKKCHSEDKKAPREWAYAVRYIQSIATEVDRFRRNTFLVRHADLSDVNFMYSVLTDTTEDRDLFYWDDGWYFGDGGWRMCINNKRVRSVSFIHTSMTRSPHFFNPSGSDLDELGRSGLLWDFISHDHEQILTWPNDPTIRLANMRDVVVGANFFSSRFGISLIPPQGKSFVELPESIEVYCDFTLASSIESLTYHHPTMTFAHVSPNARIVKTLAKRLKRLDNPLSLAISESVMYNGIYVPRPIYETITQDVDIVIRDAAYDKKI